MPTLSHHPLEILPYNVEIHMCHLSFFVNLEILLWRKGNDTWQAALRRSRFSIMFAHMQSQFEFWNFAPGLPTIFNTLGCRQSQGIRMAFKEIAFLMRRITKELISMLFDATIFPEFSIERSSHCIANCSLLRVVRVFADWRMWVYHIWLSYALFIHPSANWNRSLCTKPTFRPAGADTLLVASISTWS